MAVKGSRVRHNISSSTGTFNTLAAASTVALSTVHCDQFEQGSLSCRVSVTAATASLTLALVWQVSSDGSTWYRVSDSNNTAATVLATGTSAAVERVVSAPSATSGWRYVRATILTGGATGGASDLYTGSYNYLQDASFVYG